MSFTWWQWLQWYDRVPPQRLEVKCPKRGRLMSYQYRNSYYKRQGSLTTSFYNVYIYIYSWWKPISLTYLHDLMTSSHGNTSCITGSLWGESTSHWWIPLTKDQQSRAFMYYLLSAWTDSWTNCQVASDSRHQDTYVRSLEWTSTHYHL